MVIISNDCNLGWPKERYRNDLDELEMSLETMTVVVEELNIGADMCTVKLGDEINSVVA